jgi:hypothetical protein
MARPVTLHVCSQCGHESAKWLGRCPGCGEWNTLVEEAAPAPGAGGAGRGRGASAGRAVKPVALSDVRAESVARLRTGIGELDRVLGGGLVPGSLVLLGGSPGIGKSTLTSMALGNLAGAGRRTLYVSGEESAAQIRLRAERLPGAALQVPVLAETDLDVVLATLEAERPEVVVIDSVQTLIAPGLTGAAGSVGPGPRGRRRITRLAKARGIASILVGPRHEGGRARRPAGARAPRGLRPAVRGRARAHYRTLRALKNRFGSTNEAGVFEMRQGGPRRGRGRERALRRGGHRAPGQRRARRDGGLAAAARRGPGARLAVASSSRRAGVDGHRPQPPRARARRPGPPRRASARAPPTSSSTSRAACASTSRAPTSPSPSPWPAPARLPLAGGGAARRLLRRGRLTGELRHVGPRGPAARRGTQIRPRHGGRAGGRDAQGGGRAGAAGGPGPRGLTRNRGRATALQRGFRRLAAVKGC